MTALVLTLLLIWIGIGVFFRVIGLAIRVAVLLALTSALSVLVAMPSRADYRAWTATELLQRWMVLNEDCRDGLGDDAATAQACDERTIVNSALFSHGFCYVGSGSTSRWEMGPESKWMRRGEKTFCRLDSHY